MQRKWSLLLWGCLMMLIMGSGAAHAQGPGPGPRGGAPALGPRSCGDWRGDGMNLLGFGGNFGKKVVTGEPYSAQVTYERIQPVAGGNPIDRKITNVIYRD